MDENSNTNRFDDRMVKPPSESLPSCADWFVFHSSQIFRNPFFVVMVISIIVQSTFTSKCGCNGNEDIDVLNPPSFTALEYATFLEEFFNFF